MAGRLLCSAIRYHPLYVMENELHVISKIKMFHCFANHYFSTNRVLKYPNTPNSGYMDHVCPG